MEPLRTLLNATPILSLANEQQEEVASLEHNQCVGDALKVWASIRLQWSAEGRSLQQACMIAVADLAAPTVHGHARRLFQRGCHACACCNFINEAGLCLQGGPSTGCFSISLAVLFPVCTPG